MKNKLIALLTLAFLATLNSAKSRAWVRRMVLPLLPVLRGSTAEGGGERAGVRASVKPFFALLLLSTLIYQPSTLLAQGTAFTYNGRLSDGGSPASGSYDLTFSLFDAVSGPTQVGTTLTKSAVAVSSGLFTVELDFGANFPGADRWLDIAVRTNGAGAYTNLTPRQKILATPYAITAGNLTGTVSATGLSGTYSSAVTLNNAANSFSGNGANLTALNASQLASGTVPATALGNAWRITGNAGTTPGNDFLGTTDNQPLEFKVNNQRGLRLEPTTNTDTVNVIGGSAHNFVGAGVVGATIGGGGSGNFFGFATSNRVEAHFGTVSGGNQNTIYGGAANIGGGSRNTIYSDGANISGGYENTIQPNADYANIGGGEGNTIQPYASHATIGGGDYNTIYAGAAQATIGGGNGNQIQANAQKATIAGGSANTIEANAGYGNISGGYQNTIQINSLYATIPGGQGNSANTYAFASGRRAKAYHTGAFVWADSTDADFPSTADNQFNIRAVGGVVLSDSTPNLSFGATTRQMLNLWGAEYGIGVQASSLYFRCNNAAGTDGFIWYKGGVHDDGYTQPGAGGIELMHLVDGGLYVHGTFNNTSDRNAKQDFAAVDNRSVLEKVAQLPIQTWAYKSDPGTKHLGPVAQDFYAAFNIGPDDKHIATVDESGVALAAIQGLNEKVEVRSEKSEVRSRLLEEKLQQKETEITELRQRLEKLERIVNAGNGGGK